MHHPHVPPKSASISPQSPDRQQAGRWRRLSCIHRMPPTTMAAPAPLPGAEALGVERPGGEDAGQGLEIVQHRGVLRPDQAHGAEIERDRRHLQHHHGDAAGPAGERDRRAHIARDQRREPEQRRRHQREPEHHDQRVGMGVAAPEPDHGERAGEPAVTPSSTPSGSSPSKPTPSASPDAGEGQRERAHDRAGRAPALQRRPEHATTGG